jgi:hypothetical protein
MLGQVQYSIILRHCSEIRRCNNNGRFYHKIGKENCKQEVAEKYTQHEVTSGKGQIFIQFAQMHDTFVVSTKYDDKEKPKQYLENGNKLNASVFINTVKLTKIKYVSSYQNQLKHL